MEKLLFDYSYIENPIGRKGVSVPSEIKMEFQERVKRNWAPSMDKLVAAQTYVIVSLDSKSPFRLRGTMAAPPSIIGK